MQVVPIAAGAVSAYHGAANINRLYQGARRFHSAATHARSFYRGAKTATAAAQSLYHKARSSRSGPSAGTRSMHRVPRGIYRTGGTYGGKPYTLSNRGKVQPHLKFVDVESTAYNCNTTSGDSLGAQSITLLGNGGGSDIAVGAGSGDRIGRAVVLKSIQLSFALFMASAGTAPFSDVTNAVRLMVVLDTQHNGATGPPAHSVILQLPAVPSAQDTYQAYKNLEQGGRFKILHDRKYDIPSAQFDTSATAASYGKITTRKVFKKCHLPV